MKRGFSQSPSSSAPPPSSRFKSNPEGDSQFLDDETTKNFVRKVADHYSRRTNQTLEEREASPIIHLKKLNNWIKSVLIQLYTRPEDVVLDLAYEKVLVLNNHIARVIMVTQTITNVVRSSAFPPVYYVGIVLRYTEKSSSISDADVTVCSTIRQS